MRMAPLLTRAATVSAHPATANQNPTNPIAFWLWYGGIMLLGASAGTMGALVYAIVG